MSVSVAGWDGQGYIFKENEFRLIELHFGFLLKKLCQFCHNYDLELYIVNFENRSAFGKVSGKNIIHPKCGV